MAITRIKNNQITDSTITNVKILSQTLTGDLMNPNLTFNSNLTLNGNLVVTGNVTAVQSTTTQITDPLLTLGLGNAGTSYDLGLVLIRGSGGNRFIGWKENEGAFVFINTTEDGLTTGNIATTAYANVIFGNAITLGSSTFGGITLSGNTLSAAGDLTVRSDTGTVTIPNAAVITGATILSSTLSVVGATTVASLTSNAGIIGTTGSFSSNLTAAELTVNASATIATTLGVTGNINGSGLTLTASATAAGSLSAAGGLQATPIGNASPSTALFTTVGASSNATVAALTVNGTATIGSTLGVTGTLTGAAAQFTTINGSSTATLNAVNVNNAATVGTTLTVGGTATVNALVSNTTFTAASGTILGNLLVEGNLAVLGNLSYINVDSFTVEDPIIQLNTGPNGSPLSVDNNFDSGVSTNYFDTADRRTFFGRKDSSGFFEYFSNVDSETGNVVTGTYGTIKTGNLQLVSAATIGSTLVVGSNATVNALTVNNNATMGGTLGVVGNVIAGNVITTTFNAVDGIFSNNVTVAGTLIATSNVIANTSGIFFGNAETGLNAIYGGLPTFTLLPTTVAQFTTNVNSYSQINTQNLNSGEIASTDYVATADNGTDETFFIDMGITSSGHEGYHDDFFSDTSTANDGYLYVVGYDSAGPSLGNVGNLLLGSTNGLVKTFVGNTDTANVVTTHSYNQFAVNVDTASTGSTTGALVVLGGTGIVGTLNVTTAANLGNVTINNLTISSNIANQGLNINPNGTGVTTINSGLNTSRTVINGTAANTLVVSGTQVGVNTSSFISGATFQINAVDSMLLPIGSIGDRPGSPATGMIRFSTSQGTIEWYNGTAWAIPTGDFTVVVANSQTGDNSATVFTLPVSNASTAGTMVSINGVVQAPVSAYAITGNTVTFTEAPASTDVIDFRVFTTTSQVTEVTDIAGTTGLFFDLPAAGSQITTIKTAGAEKFSIQANGVSRFTGNVEPSANVTYGLGSTTNRWKDLWLSGSTIYLGNIQIQNTTGNTVSFVTADGVTPAALSVDISDPSGIQSTPIGNATPSTGNFTTVDATGNISASFFTGNGRLLTGIDATSIQNGTSNVKVYADGAISTGVAGSNVFVVSSFGANVTGTLGVGSMTLTSNVIMTSGDTIYLDPGSDGAGQGSVIVNGNLIVTGNTITINAQTLTIDDKDIFVANNATTAAEIDGAGIHAGNVGGVGIARWIFNNATTSWQSNVGITPSANASLSMGGTSNYWGTGYFNAVQAPSVTGTLQTAAQPNITSVGTLTGLSLPSITHTGSNGVGDIGQSGQTFATVYATTFSGVSTTAKYADLAENYSGDAVYEPGTVVHFGGSQEVTLCDEDMCRRVAGVVSTNPAYLMNSHLQGIATAVALQGRVPCKVRGTVRLGDMMVSASNGYARAEANPVLGSVIGKALANFDGTEGVIEVVVGRV